MLKNSGFALVLFVLLVPSSFAQQYSFEAGCTLPYDSIKEQHEIDGMCSIDGRSEDHPSPSDVKLAESTAKNNFCAGGTPVRIAYSDFLALQSRTNDVKESELKSPEDRQAQLGKVITKNGKKIGEGTLVRLTAFVVHAQYSNVRHGHSTKYGEAVNCYLPDPDQNDIHIMLAASADADPCDTLTAEMSPHYRPAAWTPDDVMSVGKRPVRITGPLFMDTSHKPCANGKRPKPTRASVWEIHPVYALEVCKNTTLTQCGAGAANWVALNEWRG
jgi:hypothetical protein